MDAHPLLQVLTIAEVCKAYCVSDSTVRYHIQRGNLTYRQSIATKKGVILIDTDSLTALWGEPRQKIAQVWVQRIN